MGEFFFLFLSENSRFVENGNRRILVLWKTRIGEFFFFYPRILVLWKTGTGEFSFCENPELENFFFYPRIFYCGKPASKNFLFFLSENSRFVENQNWRIFFSFLSENSRIVENGNGRILVL